MSCATMEASSDDHVHVSLATSALQVGHVHDAWRLQWPSANSGHDELLESKRQPQPAFMPMCNPGRTQLFQCS